MSDDSSKHLMIVVHSLAGGGAERVTAELATAWVDRGWRVTVLTQTDASNDAYVLDSRVKRIILNTAGSNSGLVTGLFANLGRLWRLRRAFRRERPDVVLGMMSTASILSVIAARGLGCKVIATERRHPPAQPLSPLWQRLRRWAYPRAGQVVALTSTAARWLEKQVPGCRTMVIPNAVKWPLDDTEPVVSPPDGPGRKRVLAVGRLHQVKGFDLLIEAFASIARFFPQWDLYIVGEGPEREALQRQIESAGLQERVFLPGRVGNIGQWYAAADLYVLSSRTEGLPNTLLEAMAGGLAPVAFDCDTGPREIIRDTIDGALVQPAADPDALAAHLSDLMAHEDKRKAYARRALDVRDRFSPARIMALWARVFEDRA